MLRETVEQLTLDEQLVFWKRQADWFAKSYSELVEHHTMIMRFLLRVEEEETNATRTS